MNTIGNCRIHLESVTSTNDVAWQYATDDQFNGLVVIADEQHSGRGTRGRRWHAERGTALLCSTLIKLDEQLCRPVVLTIWAGVSVCKVIDHWSQVKPVLKWPNDVLINQKKLCGILVEIRNPWCVIGIGINVHKPMHHYHEKGISNSTFLNEHTKRMIEVEEVTDSIISSLNEGYAKLLQNDQHQDLLAGWENYSGLLGRHVEAVTTQGVITGKVKSLHWNGIVLNDQSGLRTILPESILKMNQEGQVDV
ncbi:MAG: biotin--[acetyl-CoA-carboxylase] ligase [Planctomycetia bacterium]|nr:biotin--[acetyl-CoA-carboxylase] ligase [Planctomycetia bacterium]